LADASPIPKPQHKTNLAKNSERTSMKKNLQGSKMKKTKTERKGEVLKRGSERK
jgi:hypothetical protein